MTDLNTLLAEARGVLAGLPALPAFHTREAQVLWRFVEEHTMPALAHPYIRQHMHRLGIGTPERRVEEHLRWVVGPPSPARVELAVKQVLAAHYPLYTPALTRTVLTIETTWGTVGTGVATQRVLRVEGVDHYRSPHGRYFNKRTVLGRVYIWIERVYSGWSRRVRDLPEQPRWRCYGNPPAWTNLGNDRIALKARGRTGLDAVAKDLCRIGRKTYQDNLDYRQYEQRQREEADRLRSAS